MPTCNTDVSLTTSLKVGQCEVLLRDLALVFFVGERPKCGELPEDNSSSVGASASSGSMGSFPWLSGTGCKAQPLSYTSLPPRSRFFFLSRPATSCSHAAGVQPNPITPSSASLVPPVSSPFPSANGGIDLLAIGSSGCLTSDCLR